MTEARALLPEGVGRDAVDDAAEALGWALVNVHPASGDRPRRVYFVPEDGEGVVALVEDARLGAAYLEVAGHDADALLDAAVTRLGERRWEEALAHREVDPAQALSWLAVARPGARGDAVRAWVAEALSNDDDDVRRAARLAAQTVSAPA